MTFPIPSEYLSILKQQYNGSYIVDKRDLTAEVREWCNKNLKQTGDRQWSPETKADIALQDLSPFFTNNSFQDCIIVGKGPSLDLLTTQHFLDRGNQPVLAINESIHRVEEINPWVPSFAVQQDSRLKDTCYPEKGIMIISQQASAWYYGKRGVWIYNPRDLKLHQSDLTVIVAMRIAKIFGIKNFNMFCFDAIKNGQTAYAKCIGHPPLGCPTRFIDYETKIRAEVPSDGTITFW